ncbi:hypothetical protein [uncultured Ruminococcus sp.]|uniref:hypothetical protein n=1 Tax=uncultured Ruminococcus sp. TaxID=165186 RepID=UPI0025E642C2|nr:hypothetical protein [uncultured Ruminococcus sp.]
MNIIKIDCPHCGAAVERKQNEYFGTCPYCGSEVCFDDIKAEAEVEGLRQKVSDLDWKLTTDKQYKKQLSTWKKGRDRLYIISCLFSTVGFIFVMISKEEDDASVTIGMGLLILAVLFVLIGAPLHCLKYPAFFEGNEDFSGNKISRFGLLGKVVGIGLLLLCGTVVCSAIVCAIFNL